MREILQEICILILDASTKNIGVQKTHWYVLLLFVMICYLTKILEIGMEEGLMGDENDGNEAFEI